jgi:hypothetical protein
MSFLQISQCEAQNQFVVWFQGNDEKKEGDAVVTITLDKDLPIMKWEVELYALPENAGVGHEVTVNFFAKDIKNDGVFYTDSNGLEMQKRQLNKRDSWEL